MDPNATGEAKKEEIVEKPSVFEGIDLSPKRQYNELYCDYKCRMWWVHRLINHYLKGRPIWQGHMGPRYGSFK